MDSSKAAVRRKKNGREESGEGILVIGIRPVIDARQGLLDVRGDWKNRPCPPGKGGEEAL